MHLSPRDIDKLVLHGAGFLAQKRLARGLRLNYPEAVALLAAQLLELIRDGDRSVAELMDVGRKMLGKKQVLPGVARLIHEVQVEGARLSDDALSLRMDGKGRRFRVAPGAGLVEIHDGVRRLSLRPLPAYRHEPAGQDAGDDRVRAPMPGRVVAMRVAVGDRVEAGQELAVLEAMKMELALKAPREGTIGELRAGAGEFVEADAVLVVLEAVA